MPTLVSQYQVSKLICSVFCLSGVALFCFFFKSSYSGGGGYKCGMGGKDACRKKFREMAAFCSGL